MAITGIDVSQHNGKIDWKKVKSAGIEFCIIRAGYGRFAAQKDALFDQNYDGCRENGIPCGAYWYSYATTVEQARQEAETCLSVLGDRHFDYPIYFDIEETCHEKLTQAQASAICEEFCNAIESSGRWAGVYTYNGFTPKLSEEIKTRYAFWLADTRGGNAPNYKYPYGIWQYSWKGKVNGITGDVDMNKCYVDYPASINGEQPEQPEQPEQQEQPTAANITNAMKLGTKGDEVRRLQNSLAEKGYYYYDKIDGDFGKKTYGAVLAFQKDNGLEIDGIAGHATKKALGI